MRVIVKRDTWASGEPISASPQSQDLPDPVAGALIQAGKAYQEGAPDPRPDVLAKEPKAKKPAKKKVVTEK